MSLPDNEAVFNFSEATKKWWRNLECRRGAGKEGGTQTKTFMAYLGCRINESIKDLISESQTFPKTHRILIEFSV